MIIAETVREPDKDRTTVGANSARVAQATARAIEAGESVVLIAAPDGADRDQLLDDLEHDLAAAAARVIRIGGPDQEPITLKRTMSQVVGESDPEALDPIERFFNALTVPQGDESHVVLLIDGADRLAGDMTGYLRLVMSTFAVGPLPLQTVLVGGEGTWEHLEAHGGIPHNGMPPLFTLHADAHEDWPEPPLAGETDPSTSDLILDSRYLIQPPNETEDAPPGIAEALVAGIAEPALPPAPGLARPADHPDPVPPRNEAAEAQAGIAAVPVSEITKPVLPPPTEEPTPPAADEQSEVITRDRRLAMAREAALLSTRSRWRKGTWIALLFALAAMIAVAWAWSHQTRLRGAYSRVDVAGSASVAALASDIGQVSGRDAGPSPTSSIVPVAAAEAGNTPDAPDAEAGASGAQPAIHSADQPAREPPTPNLAQSSTAGPALGVSPPAHATPAVEAQAAAPPSPPIPDTPVSRPPEAVIAASDQQKAEQAQAAPRPRAEPREETPPSAAMVETPPIDRTIPAAPEGTASATISAPPVVPEPPAPINQAMALVVPPPPVAAAIPPSKPASTPRPAPPTSTTAKQSAPTAVSAEAVRAMLSRGHELLSSDDIVGARLMFERAAAAGSGEAALLAGVTYDPASLAPMGPHRRTLADPAAAAKWYRMAIKLGDDRAERFLANLDAAGFKR